MWGVYRFKEGLGGRVLRTVGAWDYPANPALYGLYAGVFPRLLALLRYSDPRRSRARQ
jgi:lipid II:glycine glycyltransferase (peptidoglycan interpeptide bridge formation enzyme)